MQIKVQIFMSNDLCCMALSAYLVKISYMGRATPVYGEYYCVRKAGRRESSIER
jgi:hypothetical protein